MEPFKSILVDVDAIASVHPAFERAVHLARRSGARLTITDVMTVPAYARRYLLAGLEEEMVSRRRQQLSRLAHAVTEVRTETKLLGRPSSHGVHPGSPAVESRPPNAVACARSDGSRSRASWRKRLMKGAIYSVLFVICAFLSACTTVQSGSAFSAGRRALLGGDDETALGFFQTVAESNPNFVFTTGSSPRQSIWSYVGRTEYLTDRFPQARQSLERALSGDREENIARLYLGLTLIQEGDRQRGLEEIQSGLRGINSFLDNINRTQGFNIGQFWDPNRDIRSAIQFNLEMISREGQDLNWQRLTSDIERIALQMERETDLARRQESREMRSRDRRRN